MDATRIEIGAPIIIPQKGARYLQPTIDEYIVDEWRALGYKEVRKVREGMRLVIEPVEKEA